MAAITGYPFDTQSVSEGQWSSMSRQWIGDGVYPHALNEFAVTNGSGMEVLVNTGRGSIQGHYVESGIGIGLPIATSDPTNPRIDRVVIRIDWVANSTVIEILIGSPAASPNPTALTRNATIWEISLAQVLVGAAVSSIAPGDITDERYNPSVCGFAYSSSPAARCRAATKPLTWPIGGLIWVEDTATIEVNVGTFLAPTWARQGPAVFATPTIVVSNVAAPGVATTYLRSDATLPIFDATVSSTQAIGDAATVGSAAAASRRDHKHAMPAFGVPPGTSQLQNTAGVSAGAAVTPLRSDAIIAAFATASPNPGASAPADAAAPGSSTWAARLDHVHGREIAAHLSAYKVGDQSIGSSAVIVNDTELVFAVPASSVWSLSGILFLLNSSTTPDIQLQLTTDSGSGVIHVVYAGMDDLGAETEQVTSAFATIVVWPMAAGVFTLLRLAGYFTNTGGATNFRLKWAQAVSDATFTTVYHGSHFLAHRLA